jgi:hypothetical protein
MGLRPPFKKGQSGNGRGCLRRHQGARRERQSAALTEAAGIRNLSIPTPVRWRVK